MPTSPRTSPARGEEPAPDLLRGRGEGRRQTPSPRDLHFPPVANMFSNKPQQSQSSHQSSEKRSNNINDKLSKLRDAISPRTDLSQSSNGSLTRIVSSRSGLVESSVTGHSISSSMWRTYFTACAGSCPQVRAPR